MSSERLGYTSHSTHGFDECVTINKSAKGLINQMDAKLWNNINDLLDREYGENLDRDRTFFE